MLFRMRNAGILCWCILLGLWSTAITLRFTTSLLRKSESDAAR